MATLKAFKETIEYRVVLIDPQSRHLLTVTDGVRFLLPVVHIPLWSRRVVELRHAIERSWKVRIFILDFVDRDLVVAEVDRLDETSALVKIPFGQVSRDSLTAERRHQVGVFVSGEPENQLSRLGWIEEAADWVESSVAARLAPVDSIEQWNAGGGFSLLRFVTEDGERYWLKATGHPHLHEFSVTELLSKLGDAFLPTRVASKPEWNAWLMRDQGDPLETVRTDGTEILRSLGDAIESMAKLQRCTVGHSEALLGAGVFDQSLEVLQGGGDAIFDFLEEATSRQSVQTIRTVEKKRLQELRVIFGQSCERLSTLAIPKTILHGDMNASNILVGQDSCQFIDWCEARVGPCLITLEHLLLFNQLESPQARSCATTELRTRYSAVWRDGYEAEALETASVFIPLVAMVSTLHGRGDGPFSSLLPEAHIFAHGRNMARRMDEAGNAPDLLRALGR